MQRAQTEHPRLEPDRREAAARPPLLRRLAPFAAIAGIVVLLDQLSKALIRAWLGLGETWPDSWELIRLTHVENSGAAFGILQGAGLFLILSSSFAIAAILVFLLWAPPQSRLHMIALALVFGGAVGNLVDRALRGTVTDFIDPTHYPAFNLADSSIVVGVGALLVLSFMEERETRRDGDAEAGRREAAGERALPAGRLPEDRDRDAGEAG